MTVSIKGSSSLLGTYDFPARLRVDVFVPEDCLWIMPPVLAQRPETSPDFITVLAHPKNVVFGQEIVDQHNEIINSPLMRALREY